MNLLIIIAFVLIVFFRSLKFKIITDDVRWYAGKKDGWGRPFSDYKWNIFKFAADRLYGGCTFLNIKWGFDKNIEIDRVFTVFLHTVICVLLYITTGSLWGSILYACNPMNNQTSLWINGRRYAVNIILVLTSCIAFQHGLWYLSLPLWAYTAYFHLTAIFTPILWGKWWVMFAIAPFLWIYRERIMGQIVERLQSVRSKELLIFFPRRIIVVIKSYGFYFFQCLFPSRTLMYYPDLHFWGISSEGNRDAYDLNRDFYMGCIGLILTMVGIILLPTSQKAMAIFAFCSLIQWCNIVYAVQTLADRYSNMALPFLMVFWAALLQHLYAPLLYACAAYYLMSLSITMRMYPIIWDFYAYHIWACPESIPARVAYANFYVNTQKFVNAWPIVEEGLKYHPNDFLLLYQAAQCWKGIGNAKMCKEFLFRAKENYYEGQEKIQAKAITDFII